jgi:enolase 1/2/3
MNSAIDRIVGRRVWDSRGRPTIEVDVQLAGGAMGRAIAPAGASRGSGEALDRRDGGAAFGGLDVRQALAAVDAEIGPALRDCDATDQAAIDAALIARDGTRDKSRIGANTMVAASMAVAHAGAAARGLPLWQHLGGGDDARLPLPEIQIFGGGAHAGRRVDVQDFMVMPVGASTFAEALDWSAEVYRAAGQIMSEAGRLRGVADEGGFWPAFDDNEQALEWLLRAIERAGYRPGEQMAISLDVAASQLGHAGRYRLARARGGAKELDRDEMAAMLLDWLQRYPIVAIEDPLGEDDAEGFARFTRAAGDRVQVIGDDFLVTNAARIDSAATLGACNAVLIKPNQAGTLTEAKSAWDTARGHGWGALVSARSGETEDTTIVHLAVGWGVGQLKVGSFSRSERMAKWNEGLRLAEQLQGGRLPPRTAFPWASGHRSSLR